MELAEILINRWLLLMYRAALVLGPMILIFWLVRPRWIKRFRIHQPKQVAPIYWQELPRLIAGLSIYLLPGVALYFAKMLFGYSPMYTDINQYGILYFIATILIFAAVTDTWFYWLHRLMHQSKALKKIHSIHHRSYNITPVSSYSFHVFEALINMAPYGALVLFLPWHPLALLIFGIFGLLYNGYIHLGYDIPMAWRKKIWPLGWLYSSTHHSIHHQEFDKNFAVYFTFWDRYMGTEKTV